MVFRAVLLDLDGTLVLSNDEHAKAWAKALSDFGIERCAEQIRALIGMGGDKIVERLAPALPPTERDALKGRRKKIFLEMKRGAVAIYHDPDDLLSRYDESPLGKGYEQVSFADRRSPKRSER